MIKLRIISDGTPCGTHVFHGDTELTGIVSIAIAPMVAGDNATLRAKIEFLNVELDAIVEAE